MPGPISLRPPHRCSELPALACLLLGIVGGLSVGWAISMNTFVPAEYAARDMRYSREPLLCVEQDHHPGCDWYLGATERSI